MRIHLGGRNPSGKEEVKKTMGGKQLREIKHMGEILLRRKHAGKQLVGERPRGQWTWRGGGIWRKPEHKRPGGKRPGIKKNRKGKT